MTCRAVWFFINAEDVKLRLFQFICLVLILNFHFGKSTGIILLKAIST